MLCYMLGFASWDDVFCMYLYISHQQVCAERKAGQLRWSGRLCMVDCHFRPYVLIFVFSVFSIHY